MLSDEIVRDGQHVMTVCNACRYCEGYCPVFQAMEERPRFGKDDLAYLANLCHNCGECLYACQYAPPHEFGINVPRTLTGIRLASYEEYCWPRVMSRAFTHQPALTLAALVAGLAVLLLLVRRGGAPPAPGAFYQVLPHHVMVALFSAVSLYVVTALGIALSRFRRALTDSGHAGVSEGRRGLGVGGPLSPGLFTPASARGVGDALTLRHLHGAGEDCTGAEESRGPWRRWLHHCTFYGFGLCFASTTVAAIYHLVFGWQAPYALTSLPVVLGTLGGLGLLVGPAGLVLLRGVRDPELGTAAQTGLDVSFTVLLFLTSGTGLLLLALRDGPSMPALLVFHLAFVLALFLTLPYGKFVHGLYRAMALVKFAGEK